MYLLVVSLNNITILFNDLKHHCYKHTNIQKKVNQVGKHFAIQLYMLCPKGKFKRNRKFRWVSVPQKLGKVMTF